MATPNVCFALLDAAVIAGRGEDPLVHTPRGPWSHARVLEEVAALGGVLRHLGVGAGTPCVVAPDRDATGDLDAVVTALAVARVGGLVTTEDDPAAPVVVATQGTGLGAGLGEGRLRLLRGEGVTEPDLDRSVMLRAGRTDPAECALLEPGSAYAAGVSVAEQIAALEAGRPPYDAAELRSLLRV